jgi:iron-sulfur cluster assembly accessory protein
MSRDTRRGALARSFEYNLGLGRGSTCGAPKETFMIVITENAKQAVRGFLATGENLEGKALRVAVVPGGCSGFEYRFSFADRQAGDEIQNCEGFDVVVDPSSLPYLDGAVVDYVDGLQGQGFTVQNPNASGSCGCGKSFST